MSEDFKELLSAVGGCDDMAEVDAAINKAKAKGVLESVLLEESAPKRFSPEQMQWVIFAAAERYDKSLVPAILRRLIAEVPPAKRSEFFSRKIGTFGRNLLQAACSVGRDAVAAVAESVDSVAVENMIFTNDALFGMGTAKICMDASNLGHESAVYLYHLLPEARREEFLACLDEGFRRMFIRDILPQHAEKLAKIQAAEQEKLEIKQLPKEEEELSSSAAVKRFPDFRYSTEQMDGQHKMLGRMAVQETAGGRDAILAALKKIADSDNRVTREGLKKCDVSALDSLLAADNAVGSMGQDILHTSAAAAAGLDPNADRATVSVPIDVIVKALFG